MFLINCLDIHLNIYCLKLRKSAQSDRRSLAKEIALISADQMIIGFFFFDAAVDGPKPTQGVV